MTPNADQPSPNGSGLSPDQLDALRPHVVVLDDGQFATGGELSTTAVDVDRIFAEHLPGFIAAQGGGPVPVMVWAHGGLVDQGPALADASRQVPWWLSNGIYPLYFVWDTRLLATLADPLETGINRLRAAGPADQLAYSFTDFTDGIIEKAVRAAGGPGVWALMKAKAQDAMAPGAGARYVADGLRKFITTDPPPAVTLHAAGHSAGSIFHSRFLPAVLESGQVNVETLSLLAPAIRTDEFNTTLRNVIGNRIRSLAMFTMEDTLERSDNCLGAYHKSLLYLIRAALETDSGTPLLGLQTCVINDQNLANWFQTGPTAGDAEAVWSVSFDGLPRSRSRSTTHGGFPEDVATMDSIARRVLNNDSIISFGTAAHESVLTAVSGKPA
jgi:hypothetical protein